MRRKSICFSAILLTAYVFLLGYLLKCLCCFVYFRWHFFFHWSICDKLEAFDFTLLVLALSIVVCLWEYFELCRCIYSILCNACLFVTVYRVMLACLWQYFVLCLFVQYLILYFFFRLYLCQYYVLHLCTSEIIWLSICSSILHYTCVLVAYLFYYWSAWNSIMNNAHLFVIVLCYFCLFVAVFVFWW